MNLDHLSTMLTERDFKTSFNHRAPKFGKNTRAILRPLSFQYIFCFSGVYYQRGLHYHILNQHSNPGDGSRRQLPLS